MKLNPLLLVLIPLFGIIIGQVTRRYALSALISNLVNLAVVISLSPIILAGNVIERIYSFSIFPAGFYLKIDLLGYIFLFIVSLVWTLTTFYSLSYMKNKENLSRYYGFLMLTLWAMIGIFIAGDLLTLFTFFELMTLASYVLVIHKENDKAHHGGNYYLYMGVCGGLLVLWGIVFIYKLTGTTVITSALIKLQGVGFLKYFIASLLIVGFGVKAGMFPVHIWLPKAHPVAPVPASALLSGVIIKAGAYGILRVVTTLYWPVITSHTHNVSLQNIGFAVMILGSITMFLGVINALLQKNIKTMLAYHSVSQMGYILVGIGLAGYLGTHGTLGFTGAIYHIINHALFKSSLFLIVGGIYLTTKEINLKYLGGLGRRYPLLAFLFLISALGISGVPGFNGYISKTLIHHGLLEALHLNGNNLIWIIEKVFVITSAGTFVSFLKFGYYVFVRKSDKELSNLPEISKGIQAVLVTFAVLIISVGLFYQTIISKFFFPLYSAYGFDIELINHLSFWGRESLLDTATYLSSGLIFFILAIRYSWFDYHLPEWVDFDGLLEEGRIYLTGLSTRISRILAKIKEKCEGLFGRISDGLIIFDRNPEGSGSVLTLKSIDFSKLIVASMLVIVLLWFMV